MQDDASQESPEDPCDGLQLAWPGLLTFDHAAAEAEGWAIGQFEARADGTPTVQLIPLDGPGGAQALRTCDDVRSHVAQRARAGSALHREALALLDPVERAAIAASFGPIPRARPGAWLREIK